MARLTVCLPSGGRRLDALLAVLFQDQGLSRSRIQRLMEEGRVTLDGAPAKASAEVREGQVVVIRRDRPLIKRIDHFADGQVHLLGDNPARSTDSRHFGPVPRAHLEAVIIAKLP